MPRRRLNQCFVAQGLYGLPTPSYPPIQERACNRRGQASGACPCQARPAQARRSHMRPKLVMGICQPLSAAGSVLGWPGAWWSQPGQALSCLHKLHVDACERTHGRVSATQRRMGMTCSLSLPGGWRDMCPLGGWQQPCASVLVETWLEVVAQQAAAAQSLRRTPRGSPTRPEQARNEPRKDCERWGGQICEIGRSERCRRQKRRPKCGAIAARAVVRKPGAENSQLDEMRRPSSQIQKALGGRTHTQVEGQTPKTLRVLTLQFSPLLEIGTSLLS